MKKYIKFFLLLLVFALAHTAVVASDLPDDPTVECKVKTPNMDKEENSKDLKLDMLICYTFLNENIEKSSLVDRVEILTSDACLNSPFKPPRA